MDERLQDLLDHHEIRKLLAAYCRGCDRLDAELMATLYHADSWVDQGPNHCRGPEFVNRSMTNQAAAELCTHMLGQSLIEVRGDEAGAETYFLMTLRRARPDGAKVLTFMAGRYADTLRRKAGRWGVEKRVCIRDWSYAQPVTDDPLAEVEFVQGARSGEDATFAVLSRMHSGRTQIDAV